MKTIIFDWGGVLIDHPIEKIAEVISKEWNIPKEDIIKVKTKYNKEWHLGNIKEEEIWNKEFGISNNIWEEAFKESVIEKKEMFAIAEHFKRNGFKIAILSNTEKEARKNMDSKYDMFDEIILSWEERCVKPDEKIYKIALERLGVKAEEAVFIDDKQANVDAANKLGIKGFLFENIEKTKKFIYDLVY